MDSTIVVPAVIDSATAAGWLWPLADKYLAWMPAEYVVLLIGFAASLVVDLVEDLVNLLSGVPIIKQIQAFWQRYPRFVGPILALLSGSLVTGSWLGGIVGAGVRSILFKGSITQTTVSGLRKAGGAVAIIALLGCAWAPGTAGAEEAPPPVNERVSWLAMERFHVALGVGQRFENDGSFDIAFPDERALGQSFAAIRLTYGIFDPLAAQAEVTRGIWHSKLWEARVGLYLHN